MKSLAATALILTGLLNIASAAKDWSGAELFSTGTFQFGRFEARMLMASGNGLVSSMFTYYNESYVLKEEPWREIDIEVLGKNPGSFQSNLITRKPIATAKKVTSEQHHTMPPATNEAYHTYAIEWTPDSICWYIDDVQVRKSTTQQTTDMQDKPHSLRFNLWAAKDTNWVGKFDESILPVNQFISWVKVYDYTPGAGPNGSNFTLSWTDDFDTFDDTRWGAGNWTFAENLVDLVPENLTVKDGALVLSLTKSDATGFSGTVPKDDGSTAIWTPRTSLKSHLGAPVRWFDLLGRPGTALR